MLTSFAVPRLLVVYNPIEQARTSMVTVYVSTPKVHVLNAHGQVVRAQVSAVWNDASHAANDVFQVRSTTSMHHIKALRVGCLWKRSMRRMGIFQTSPCLV